jgi:tRNA(Ile)-lysidine synthase
MIKKVFKFIEDNKMFDCGEGVILGVSGGADSICMLHILMQLQEKLGIDLYVVHVHHGIRGDEADKDAEFVQNICNRWRVPCTVEHINVPKMAFDNNLSEEEAGRIARYEIFNNLLKKYNASKIAVAHNLNDNSETILFNMFRGSGIKGMSGIAAKRDNVVRPVLCCTRTEIEQYLNENNLNFCTDSTNSHTDYSRNKLRLEVIPYIKTNINERAEYNIINASESIREAYEYIRNQAEGVYNEVIKNNVLINLASELPPVVLKEIIRMWIFNNVGLLKDVTGTHIQMVVDLLNNQVSKKIMLPYNMVIEKIYDGVIIKDRQEKIYDNIIEDVDILKTMESDNGTKIHSKEDSVTERVLIEQGKIIPDERFSIDFEPEDFNLSDIEDLMYTKWLDYDKINELILRTRRPGDYIVVDEKGSRKKLKDYFINEKIPREERDKILLLADGSHIIWIVGYRISQFYKVIKDTKKVIKITYEKE